MRRDQYLEKLARVPMFQACTKKDLLAIGRVGDAVKFVPGDVLVHEGDMGREFFVLLSGRATVTRDGGTVADLGSGDYFGELALLDPGPRNASVTAVTEGEALVIRKPEFLGLLAETPNITTRVLVGMARRLHDADKRPMR